MKNLNNIININVLLCKDYNENNNSILNSFTEISYKEKTDGKFHILIFINAMSDAKHLIRLLLVRNTGEEKEVLELNDFIVPPNDNDASVITQERTSTISVTKKRKFEALTNLEMPYAVINKGGDYLILVYQKEISDSDSLDNIKLKDMDIKVSKEFKVNIEI